MGTTFDKLRNAFFSKIAIKAAIAKYDPTVGDVLSTYAPIISEMADKIPSSEGTDLGTFVSSGANDVVTIPYNNRGTLRDYICFGLHANEVIVANGYTNVLNNTFRNLNNGSTETLTLRLPNTIVDLTGTNVFLNSYRVVPVLENGWKASASFHYFNSVTSGEIRYMSQQTAENMLDALADLSQTTSESITFSTAVYNTINSAKISAATAKNWQVLYV